MGNFFRKLFGLEARDARDALPAPKYTVAEIAHYWDSNNIEKKLKDGTFNKLSDDEWMALEREGKPYLIAMIQRMKMSDDEAYEFFERGPKKVTMNKTGD